MSPQFYRARPWRQVARRQRNHDERDVARPRPDAQVARRLARRRGKSSEIGSRWRHGPRDLADTPPRLGTKPGAATVLGRGKPEREQRIGGSVLQDGTPLLNPERA